MTLMVKITNLIQAQVLQDHLFKVDELDAAYGDLLLQADVWWLSRGKVLKRFVDLLLEIKTFLSTKNKKH